MRSARWFSVGYLAGSAVTFGLTLAIAGGLIALAQLDDLEDDQENP